METLTFILSLAGALAWLPTIGRWFKRPKIECKILKYNWLINGGLKYYIPFSSGITKEVNGNVYKIKARIVSKKNDYSISDFKIKVKFNSMSEEMDAYVYYSPNFEEKNTGKIFETDMNTNILFCPVLKEDQCYDLDIHFVVENNNEDIQYIKFIFLSSNKQRRIVKVKKDDFTHAVRSFE